MRRTLRLGRTAILLVAVVLLGAGVHFLHAFQLTRNASVLFDQGDQAKKQADEAKKAGDFAKAAEGFGKAADYYGRYLGFHPDDPDALAKLGFVLEEQAKSPRQVVRAFLVLEKAVRADPGRNDVRRRLADLAVKMGRTLDAREHLEYLLKNSSPNDPELEVLLGRCEESDGHFQKAADDYELARTHDPSRAEAYVQLAKVLRTRLDRAGDADSLMDEMVKRNPNSGPALLARGQYLSMTAQLSEDPAAHNRLLDLAARDVAAARQLAPDDVEALLTSADLKQQARDEEGALRDLEEGWKSHPTEVRFLLGQISVQLRAGRREEAVAHLRESLKVLSGKAEEQWVVADLFIDAGQPDDARTLLESLRAEGPSPAADFLEARLDVVDHKYAAAVALLEDRRKSLAASPDLARQADVLLGLCYEQLGNPDQQLAAFRRAAEQDPSWLPARLGQASALLATGKFDDALAEYRQLAPRSPEARLQAIRLLIVRNLRTPPASRSWTEANALAKDAPEDLQKTTDFRLVKINLLGAQGLFADAWKGLNDAIADEPKEMRYRILQADLADFGKGRKDWTPDKTSQEILDRAQTEVGDTVDLRLARATRLFGLAHEEAVKGLGLLEANADHFEAADQERLFAGLAEAYARTGDLEKAVALCRQARDRSKDDLGIRLRLFDLSLTAFEASIKAKGKEGHESDRATLQEIVDDVRGIEGVDGVFWRACEASLLLFQARHGGDKAGLKDARALLAEVGKRRPDWSRPALFEAELDELEGDLDAAIAKYRQAIDLGERQPEVIRQAAQLLVARRRYQEAREVLQKLGQTPSGDLGRLAVAVSLLNREKENVLPKTTEDAAKNSKDYHDLLWLGQVYEALDKKGEAKAAFDRAIELDASAPEPRAALVLFLIDENKKEEAKKALDEADKGLPADKKGPVLAVGYEALGQRGKAEEYYAGLLKGKPDVADLRTAAAFYLRGGEVGKAEPLLQQIIDAPGRSSDEPVLWARRTLALTLAAGGDYQQSNDALRLLDQNLREQNAPEDQRAKAIVLASRPGGRKESIQTLEESFSRLRPTRDEEFLLARLYEADRDWDHANEHFLALVGAKGGANPLHLAYYIQALLRRNDVNEAAAWLQRLEALEPDDARTVGVKARVLAKQGQGAAAARLVEDFADKTFQEKKNAAVLGDAASLLEELQRPVEAEKKYREYVKAVEVEQPEKTLVLAAFLARQDRLTESLDVIEAVWPKCKPETAARTAMSALRVGRPTPQHLQRVDSLLREAIMKNPTVTNLLVSMADLRDAQGQDAEAEKLYREILNGNPRNPLALNNLAWLLAFQAGKGAEALELVKRRIEITGPSPSVLDTQGMVLLKLGRAEDAVQQFSYAAAQAPAAIYYFHLAEAQKAAGQPNEAEKAAQKVDELGLKEADVHPLEKADYQKWLDERKPKGN